MGIFEAKIRAKPILIGSLTVQSKMANDCDCAGFKKTIEIGL
jgi:hypothetical protein